MVNYDSERVVKDEKHQNFDSIPRTVSEIVKNALTLIGPLPSPPTFGEESHTYYCNLGNVAKHPLYYTIKRNGTIGVLGIRNNYYDLKDQYGQPKYKVYVDKDSCNAYYSVYRENILVLMDDIDLRKSFLPPNMYVYEEWTFGEPSIVGGISLEDRNDSTFDPENPCDSIFFSPRGLEALERVNELLEIAIRYKRSRV